MAEKNNNNLFFTCSLIEYIGRKSKRTRKEVTDFLGKERIGRIYEYADVFHCEPIEKVAAEFIEESGITAVSYTHLDVYKRQDQRRQHGALSQRDFQAD